MLRSGVLKAFHPQAFFAPRSVLLVGASTGLGRAIGANMGGFGGDFAAVEPGCVPDRAFDLAVLACGPEEVSETLDAVARAGTYAAVCATPAPGLASAAKAAGVRVLGPSSFGVVVPKLGLNASAAHVPVAAGKVALVSQSAALCRTVLDWAGPNGVGFSYVIGTGANVDRGFSLALDWLSRDAGTGAILLDIRSIRDRRSFLAAARAAARLRPVVALRAGGRTGDPSGREDAVFEAALRRVGVVRVSGLADFLGAAEVLTRARPPRTERLAIATNAVGAGHMAADAAVAAGLSLVGLEGSARTLLRLALPEGPADPGIVWTGANEPIRVAEAAAMLAGLPETGGIIAVLAPTGPGDAAGVEALVACRAGVRTPLLACVLGETTGSAHRRRLAAAGVPVFATPESAVRAFALLVRQKRARAAAVELPPRRVLEMVPDQVAVAAILSGQQGLTQGEALRVLAAYGMAVVPGRVVDGAGAAEAAADVLGYPAVVKRVRDGRPRGRESVPGEGGIALDLMDGEAVRRAAGRIGPGKLLVQLQMGRALELRITVADDPLFGPTIGFGLGGTAAGLLGDVAYDLPPLNLALARALIGRTRAAEMLLERPDLPAANVEAIADALVRVSQLVIDHPTIDEVDINPLFADAHGVQAADAWIGLRAAGERSRFAITPYPAELAAWFEVRDGGRDGGRLLIRPIRPEDAEAHGALFKRLSPEDVRYRFFNVLKELQPEQIVRMTQVDYDREIAFVAVTEQGGETVGVSRLVREPGTDGGEFAVVVDPAVKGRGVARRLMLEVMAWGRGKGMADITGQVLAENAPMLAFMRKMGAMVRRMPNEPEVMEAVIRL